MIQATVKCFIVSGLIPLMSEIKLQFYTSVFEGSAVRVILRYNKRENKVEGAVKHAQFMLGHQGFSSYEEI